MRLNVVGVGEAARLLGVENARPYRWTREGRMPPPVARLASTPVWQYGDIMLMVRRYTRKGKTPPKWNPKNTMPPPDFELVGVVEACEILGLSRPDPKPGKPDQRKHDKKKIARWRETGEFPEPLLEKRDSKKKWKPGLGLSRTPLWSRDQIEHFAAEQDIDITDWENEKGAER